jgi:hypothetical protein
LLSVIELVELEATKQAVLSTAPLYAWHDLQSDSTLLPKSPGFYAWFFTDPPDEVPIGDCCARDRAYLVYLGIASSKRSLRDRVREHFTMNAEGSTLRKSLGCLLEEKLSTVLTRIGSRRTFSARETALTQWMQTHGRVVWFQMRNPERIENQLVTLPLPPLNLDQNEAHPFHRKLKEIRSRARQRADAAARSGFAGR